MAQRRGRARLLAGLGVLAAATGAAATTQAVDRSARITTNGLGPIRIGMTAAEVRQANGGSLGVLSNAAGDGSCATAEIGPPRVFGLFTNGVLARVYVDAPGLRTRKGIGVGDNARDVRRAYGRNLSSAAAPYDPRGRELRVTLGNRRMVFTTRSTGRIIEISAGRFPEIRYIEGCA